MLRSLVGRCRCGWQGCAGRTRFVVGMREVAEAAPCGQPTARLIDAAPTYLRYPFGSAFGIESYRVLRQMDVSVGRRTSAASIGEAGYTPPVNCDGREISCRTGKSVPDLNTNPADSQAWSQYTAKMSRLLFCESSLRVLAEIFRESRRDTALELAKLPVLQGMRRLVESP